MELTKKEKTAKYIVYCLLIAGAALLQNVGGLFPQLSTARCFLLIPVVIILGIDEDEKNAALMGLLGGALWDIFSVQHMGFNCIYLMVMCYISSALVSYIFRNTFWVSYISTIIPVFLYSVLYWLMFIAARRTQGSISAFFTFYLPCAIYTCAVSFLVCAVLKVIKKKLNKETAIMQ